MQTITKVIRSSKFETVESLFFLYFCRPVEIFLLYLTKTDSLSLLYKANNFSLIHLCFSSLVCVIYHFGTINVTFWLVCLLCVIDLYNVGNCICLWRCRAEIRINVALSFSCNWSTLMWLFFFFVCVWSKPERINCVRRKTKKTKDWLSHWQRTWLFENVYPRTSSKNSFAVRHARYSLI